MARFNCRSCGFDGRSEWDGRLVCPRCNDRTKVGVAIAGWELAEVKLSLPEAIVPIVQQRITRRVRGGGVTDLARDVACHVNAGIRNLVDMFRARIGTSAPLQQVGLTPEAALPVNLPEDPVPDFAIVREQKMRYMLIAAASLLTTPSWAAPAVITENLTGTIDGAQTVDTKKYFGTAGADLSGSKVAIYVQYVPKLLGPSQTCRNNACTYNGSTNMPDTQGSLLVTITINGHRVVYSPTYQGAVFFAVKAPYQLTIDSDAFSGFGIGLPGVQFAALFESAPKFGQVLSPDDKPVFRNSPSDYLYFYDATDQTPVEKLTYKPASAAK